MDRIAAIALLALMLAGVAVFQRGDRGEWASFRALGDTRRRQSYYRRWAIRLWGFFAAPAIVSLVLLGRVGAVATLPIELCPAARLLPSLDAAPAPLLVGMAGGFVAGLLALVLVRRLRRGRMPGTIGNVGAMLPRNRAELCLAAGLAISAGISEELAFRLALPLLTAIATGSAIAAVLFATLLFGALHLYQGRAGVIATTLVGAVLMAVMLATGSLWIAILLHVAMDLSALVLRPALAGVWRR